MAKSVMTLIALLVRVISIWMTPARRAKVPEISRPLAFMAGSQTCKMRTLGVTVSSFYGIYCVSFCI